MSTPEVIYLIKMNRPDILKDHISKKLKKLEKESRYSYKYWAKETAMCAEQGVPLPWEEGYVGSIIHKLLVPCYTNPKIQTLDDGDEL